MNNKTEYVPSVFGVQCDAITRNGTRCKKLNTWEIPCKSVYDAQMNSYRADKHRSVSLCDCHHIQYSKLKRNNDRLKLHHRGWLGAFNEYHFGNLVLAVRKVDWKTIKALKVPKYWR